MEYVVFDDMNQCTEAEVQRLLPLVPAWRREYALRYKHTFGQFCCLKAWEMVEQACGGERVACGVVRGEWGKPYMVGESGNRGIGELCEFSISHCKAAIAVAVDSHPIGIDVERIRHADQSLLERTMNEAERRLISASAQPDRVFTRLWTQKEAYLKYTGTGLTDDLPSVLIQTDPNRFIIIEKEQYILSIYHE